MLALASRNKTRPNSERERALEADITLSELITKRLIYNTVAEQSDANLATSLLSGLGVSHQGSKRQ